MRRIGKVITKSQALKYLWAELIYSMGTFFKFCVIVKKNVFEFKW